MDKGNSSNNPTTESSPTDSVVGEFVTLMGETYYRIANYDAMSPFFMTIVSSADHWLFVASTGGLAAGRINADHALFPYYTEDRITENADNTGSKTIIRVLKSDTSHLWEPFIDRAYTAYTIERALYKNTVGTALVFEEVNVDLGLIFRYAWRTSASFGIVKTAWLVNQSEHTLPLLLTDGIQNILPAHITSNVQNEFSVLLDAYKRSEIEQDTGLGQFSLSSRLTDLAEPSEALRANTVWQAGIEPSAYLLSSMQLGAIRAGHNPAAETDIRGRRGAYFIHAEFDLQPQSERSWHLVAEVDQDAGAVANLLRWLRETPDVSDAVEQDIADSTDKIRRIVSGADGVQVSGDEMGVRHHFANVLFNVMRGGTFANRYNIDKADLLSYIDTHDRSLWRNEASFFDALPDTFTVSTLKELADAQDNVDLIRLCYTYLPLTFSRRHGDPSRPWNRFSINLKKADGSPQLNYEGNWRDIFQNWEALAFSYPEFLEGMIAVFLNATTIDGYNPYRIMRDGVDWEVPEPDNPWANIGYWSDHQIIYLQKLMEACERFYPGKLNNLLARPIFAHANVPYRIKRYADIVQNPDSTINFDWDAAAAIDARVTAQGTDGKLLMDEDGAVLYSTLVEKLLTLLLAKLVNFVPDGGIWMNTQRPEWNDANNTLVGKGLSVVTTCYLRRFVVFFRQLIANASDDLIVTQAVHTLYSQVEVIFKAYQLEQQAIGDKRRRTLMDSLGNAGSQYRWQCYEQDATSEYTQLSPDQLADFLALTEDVLNRTIQVNRRDDALFHAYNTLHLDIETAQIRHLQVMLEGQAAVLSSGLLDANEVTELLQSLRKSPLYREDQHSYILYPNRQLAGFMEKNTIEGTSVGKLKLVQALVDRNDSRLILRDVDGQYHFGGDLRNAKDVTAILDDLATQPNLTELVKAESADVLALFEQAFKHDMFTGRSGSFFAYEGLGSVYWHMVSKLLLAVQENIYRAATSQSEALNRLIDIYYDIRNGLGFNKSPDVYGAFPLDPYSHTPLNQGAKQPGMTGMVKEEILTRLGEVGIVIEDGMIVFNPVLLRQTEWLDSPTTLRYWDVDDNVQQIDVPARAFAFTLCRVPIMVQQADQNHLSIELSDGTQQSVPVHHVESDLSRRVFAYDGFIRQITISYDTD